MPRQIGGLGIRAVELDEILGLWEQLKKQDTPPMIAYKAIGEELGRDPAVIAGVIRRLRPTADSAKIYIKSKALKLAMKMVRDAKVPEIMDILSRPSIGVLDPPARNEGGGGGFFLSVTAETCGAVKIVGGQAPERLALPAPVPFDMYQEVKEEAHGTIDVAQPVIEGSVGAARVQSLIEQSRKRIEAAKGAELREQERRAKRETERQALIAAQPPRTFGRQRGKNSRQKNQAVQSVDVNPEVS